MNEWENETTWKGEGDWNVVNVGGMKLGEWENPEENPKYPAIAHQNCSYDDDEIRSRDPNRDWRAV